MAITKKIAQPFFLAVLILGLTQNIYTALPAPGVDARADAGVGYGYPKHLWGGGYKQSIELQQAEERKLLRVEVAEAKRNLALAVVDIDQRRYTNEITLLESRLDSLLTLEDTNGKIGKAFLQGFAGNDAQLFVGQRIPDWQTGLGLGLAVATAQHASKSVGKVVEDTADLVIGGTWRAFLAKLVAFMQFISNGIFHGGHQAYSVVTLRGIQGMIKVTFSELGKTLVKAVQDKTRGVDMTLRPTDDQAQAVARINGWEKICEAYIRQFDHIIVVLDERINHYQDNPDVIFYANEIVHCITDVKALLRDGKNMRDLYERLDSNQALINAFNANISNLFDRLIELVNQPSSKESNANAQSKPTAPNPRPSYADRDESMFGHSFSGN